MPVRLGLIGMQGTDITERHLKNKRHFVLVSVCSEYPWMSGAEHGGSPGPPFGHGGRTT